MVTNDNPPSNEKKAITTKKPPQTFIESFVWENLIPMDGVQGQLGLLILLLNSLQSLGIVFSSLNQVGWTNGYGEWLTTVADAVLLQKKFFHDVQWLYTFLGMPLMCFGLFVFAHLLKSSSQREWSGVILRLANLYLVATVGIGSLPISSALGSHLSCTSFDASGAVVPYADCWTGSFVLNAVLAILAMALVLVLKAVKELFLIETVAYDNVILSKAHGRIDACEQMSFMLILFLRSAVLSVTSASLQVKLAIDVGVLLVSLAFTVAHIMYGPYYYKSIQLLKTLWTIFLTWCCVSVLFLDLAPGSGYEAALLIYCAGLLVVFLGFWVSKFRVESSLHAPYEKLSGQYEYEFVVRHMLLQNGSFFTHFSSLLSGVKPDLADESYKKANQIYGLALKNQPDKSFLYLSYGDFLFGKGNLNFCLTIYSKGKRNTKLSADVEFMMFKRSHLIEKVFASQKGTVEVKNYFRFLELNTETDALQGKFIAVKLGLLSELRKAIPNMRKVSECGLKTHKFINTIQDNYKEMFALNPEPKILRKYASFVSNMVGNQKLTKVLVDHADKLDMDLTSGGDGKRLVIDTQSALFYERNAVFVISGEENNLGEILDVNLGGVDMFGFTHSSEVIGTNINVMMPNPFSEMHGKFLKNYLETGYASVLDMSRSVVARTKAGFLFEVKLYVRQIVNNQGVINFVGVMAKSEEQPELVIIDPQGYLVAVSQNCINIFKLDDDDASHEMVLKRLRQIHVATLLPNWETKREEYSKDQGMSMIYKRYQMHVKATELSFIRSQHCLIELWVDPIQSDMGGASVGSFHTHQSHAQLPTAIESAEDEVRPREEPKLERSVTPDMADVVPAKVVDTGSETASKTDSPEMPRKRVNSSNESKKDILDYRKMQRKDSEVQDMLLQNTALNMGVRMNQLMSDYDEKATKRANSRASLLRNIFRFLGVVFLASMVGGNIYTSQNFTLLNNALQFLVFRGEQNFEIQRVLTSARTLEFLNGCDRAAVPWAQCNFLTQANLTNYSPTEIRTVFTNAATGFREWTADILFAVAATLSDPKVGKGMAPRMSAKTIAVLQLREQEKIVSLVGSSIEVGQRFGLSANHLADNANSVFLTDFNGRAAARLSADRYFNVSDPFLNRASYYVLTNGNPLLNYIEGSALANRDSFLSYITDATLVMLVSALLPSFLLMLAVLVYVLPNMYSTVASYRDALLVTFKIPRTVIKWWYTQMVRALEAGAKEEEEGVTAELYMYLSGGEGDENLIDGRKHKKLEEMEEETIQNITLRKALGSMSQQNVVWKFGLASTILAVIPLISLFLLIDVNLSHSIPFQMDWYNQVLIRMSKAHYQLRDGLLETYAGNATLAQVHLDSVTQYIGEAKAYQRYLIYGFNGVSTSADSANFGTRPIPGLGTDAFYSKVFFGDACTEASEAYAKKLVLQSSCYSYANGRLSYGLNDALLMFYGDALGLQAQLGSVINGTGNYSAIAAAQTIRNLETLLYQISAVALPTRKKLGDILTTAGTTSQTIIGPIQLILAFLVAFFVYNWIYTPTIKSLEDDSKRMDGLITILHAVFDNQSNASNADLANNKSKGGEPGSARGTLGRNNRPSLSFDSNANVTHPIKIRIESSSSMDSQQASATPQPVSPAPLIQSASSSVTEDSRL